MPEPRRRDVAKAAWPQAAAVLAGVLLVVLGVVGFGASGLDGFAEHGHERLFGLAVNPLHNLVHVAAGVAGIVLSARLRGARAYGWGLAIGMGAVFAYGVAVAGSPDADVLNTNWPVNWLHLGLAVLGVVIAVVPATPRPVPVAPADVTAGPAKDASPAEDTDPSADATAAASSGRVVEPVAESRESLREQA